MSSTKKNTEATEESPAQTPFTEFTLSLPKKPVTIKVVTNADDLPRAAKRRMRNVLTDSATDQMINNGPKFQLGVDYAIAYAASQGVNVNLDGIESDADYDRVRMELVTAGLQLIGHFAAFGGAEGKASQAEEVVEAEAGN